jgi:3-hydroxyisobutyrate dehydrogenase-like beta-hydroxyacid dehydrogenase
MATIAVLGTGHMGAQLARRLLGAGHTVTVWNRTPERAAPLTEDGARLATSPADAVRDVSFVLTMLADATAVEAVLCGADGAAAALRPGTCVIDMSTIGPEAVGNIAKRLPDGISLVDAPVAGSADAAAAGQLTVLLGGEKRDIDRVATLLEPLGAIRRCGGPGSGAAVKLVVNTALLTGLAALADTLAVASAVGVDRDTALDLIKAGPLGGAVPRAVSRGAVFPLSLAEKDMGLALAELGNAPAPVARATARALHDAEDRSADLASIV